MEASRKYVIYMGVIFIPAGNAAPQRAYAMAKMIKKCGYSPVIVGMHKNENRDVLATEQFKNDISIYSMSYPTTILSWLRTLYSIQDLCTVINHLGKENIKAIIAMDYYSIALLRIINLCQKHNIIFVADAVDWFAKSQYKFPKNFIKDIDTFIRMQWIYKQKINLIAISKYLYSFYSSSAKKIVYIPGVIDSGRYKRKHELYESSEGIIKFAFVGSPGKKCEKEKIDWMIRIICELNKTQRRAKFIIAGIDKETLGINRPDLVQIDNFDESVECLGRISHVDCINLLMQSDYAIIVREDNRLSNAGFPTKLGESFACGVPIVATPTSDIKDYISHFYGVISEECTEESLKQTLNILLTGDAKSRCKMMHETVLKDNPLECDKFISQMHEILS